MKQPKWIVFKTVYRGLIRPTVGFLFQSTHIFSLITPSTPKMLFSSYSLSAAGLPTDLIVVQSRTLARVRLPAAAVGGPPGTIVVERGTLLTVIPRGVVSTQAPTRHLEDTSGPAQLLHLH